MVPFAYKNWGTTTLKSGIGVNFPCYIIEYIKMLGLKSKSTNSIQPFFLFYCYLFNNTFRKFINSFITLYNAFQHLLKLTKIKKNKAVILILW